MNASTLPAAACAALVKPPTPEAPVKPHYAGASNIYTNLTNNTACGAVLNYYTCGAIYAAYGLTSTTHAACGSVEAGASIKNI